MKPSEEEINDAMRRKLRSSLENFEYKPDTDVDRKMYKMLNKTPAWKEPYVIWSLLGLLFFAGTGLLTYKELSYASKSGQAILNSKLKTVKENSAGLSSKKESKAEKRSTDINNLSQIQSGKTEKKAAMAVRDNTVANEKPDSDKLAASQQKLTGLLPAVTEAISPHQSSREGLDTKRRDKPKPAPSQANSLPDSKNTALDLKLTERLEPNYQSFSKQIITESDSNFADDGENSTINKIRDLSKKISNPGLLISHSDLINTSDLTLPEVKYRGDKNTASFAQTNPDSSHKKLYIDWSEMKKVSLIFSAVPFQTLQQVNIQSRSGLRIQEVSLPGKFSTPGYKLGIGLEKGGFQLLANFSRIHTHLSYAYASTDEFKVVEVALNSYEIIRLGEVRSHSSVTNLLGLGFKKQIDFTSRQLGRLYTTAGAEYSRSLGSTSTGFFFVNLSSGKRFVLNASTTVNVGPYFEYSFGRIAAAGRQIMIRPSQVGISVQLKLSQDK